jgi:hypothetical protein
MRNDHLLAENFNDRISYGYHVLLRVTAEEDQCLCEV